MTAGRLWPRSSLTVGGLLIVAAQARAQGHDQACGDTSFAARELERDFAAFTDPNGQWPPHTGITRLSPSDVHRVVTDPRECRRVLHAATRLPPRRKWGTHWVYRFGPYYVAAGGLPVPARAFCCLLANTILVRLQPGDSATLAARVSPDLAKRLPPDN